MVLRLGSQIRTFSSYKPGTYNLVLTKHDIQVQHKNVVKIYKLVVVVFDPVASKKKKKYLPREEH